ncbi:penicillin-binding protein 1C [Paucibacter aquatile]|uniref:peptidoglycan glycosyltransferase n=1 Tax=Kinneretia aquatilis TaxID=2070761 RepID=A0A2N8L3R4_9BURK|nr:penicillin-binding protein 1C [Paucibacter aquatile]PND40342.1 penicillin-binding protein 1C [Paucibacter aquatile]
MRGCVRGAWLLAGLLLAASAPALAQPSFQEIKAAHRVSDLTLLDRRGEPLQTLRLDPQRRVLDWLPLSQLSPALLQAILLGEDRRFYEHSGVDWSAVASSAWANLWNQRTRGASTVTMQLAGLIDAGLARPAGGRSAGQKLGQVWLASQLERRWSKAQILEAYLNSVPFRGELVGIHALSQVLFGKHPSGLTAVEGALAAALLRAPNAGVAAWSQRACGLLKLQGLGCEAVAGQAEAALLRPAGMPLGEQLAPHFARQVLRAEGPAQQRSSLDAGLQRQAARLLKNQLAELGGRNVEDGAVLVLDNASGQVRAWVGSSGAFSAAAQVDGVLARRQPGSTLKPFIYQLALERRLITAASLLEDSPAQINTPAGLYIPQNYDRQFKGFVSARSALGSSLNVPAVRLMAMLGSDAVFERLNQLGLQLSETAGFYGLSLALGSADVTLLNLANAYRSLANGGVLGPVQMQAQVQAQAQSQSPAAQTGRRRVAEAGASFIVADMLADNNARAISFGLDSPLALASFAAVKTGTSKDMRDNWCLGFSDRYTVGVWVGNASGAPMHGVSGISGAAPVWAGLMRYLHQGRPSRAPAAPASVLPLTVQFDGVPEPARREWFVRGTEQVRWGAGSQLHASAEVQGIRSPVDGSVFALDPDMPPQAQKIRFEGQSGQWELDGRILGRGRQLNWAPWPGRHQLRLLDARGRELQRLSFEVRGAQLKPGAPGSPVSPARARPAPSPAGLR